MISMVIQYTNAYQNCQKNTEIVWTLQVHVINYLLFENQKMKISNENDKVTCTFEYGDRTDFIGAGMNVIYGMSSCNNNRHK